MENLRIMELTVVVPTKGMSKNITENYESWLAIGTVLVVDSYPGCLDLKKFCKTYGLHYLEFKWNGNYPKKRQWALNEYNFSTKWVLFLDDDEFVPKRFREYILHFKPGANYGAYSINYENWFLGKKMRFGIPMKKTPLIELGSGCFQNLGENFWSDFDMEVHEHFITQKSLGLLRSKLEHRQLETFSSLTMKHLKYAEWEISRARDGINYKHKNFRSFIKNKLFRSSIFPIFYFIINYFVKFAILDGRPGLFYSILKAHYFAIIVSGLRK